MSQSFKGLVVVIPTRNRARLAMNAVRSVISQEGCNASILVSDNSTEPQESLRLARFCEQINNDRVSYIKPPSPLSMTEHYDWAIQQALSRYHANHFTFLTDRMIFKQKQLAEVVRIVSLVPDKVVSYLHDRVMDYSYPVYLDQHHWTGEVFTLQADHLLRLSSHLVTHDALPRIMNCVVPRSVFDSIRSLHGTVFDSIAPDFNFCYRCLEICESIVYYDKSVLVHYALDRSNGESQARGLHSKDHLDFIANLGQRRFNFASPIPEILTVNNAIAHEYCYVKSETCSDKFPEIDMGHYLSAMAGEVERLENSRLKEEMHAILAQHGWLVKQEVGARPAAVTQSLGRKLVSPRLVFGKLGRIANKITSPFWSLGRSLGMTPPGNPTVGFKTTADALKYAAEHPPQRSLTAEHISFLCPTPVDLGQGAT